MSIFGKIRDWLQGQSPRPTNRPSATPSSAAREADAYFASETNWISVSSSNVEAIAFFMSVSNRGRGNVLGVRFLNGAEYRYEAVPLSVWQDFRSASSKGRFIWARLRDKYPYERVR